MTAEKASIIFEYLIPQIESETKTTSRTLAAVPNDKDDYKPSEKCMSAKELAMHIVVADPWFLESVASGQFGQPDETATKDKPVNELASIYERRMTEAVGRIKAMSGEQLAASMKFFMFELPAIDIIQLMLKHSVHHRGQLTSYLRPMGGKVPAIYGGSADEPMTTTENHA